jgi:hypothetical protein
LRPAAPTNLSAKPGEIVGVVSVPWTGAVAATIDERTGSISADSTGLFRIEGVSAGTHVITVRALGLQPTETTVVMPREGLVVRIRPNQSSVCRS